MSKIPHHEFWNGRLYESPGYLYLAWQCLIRGLSLRTLFKANFGLDHGGASFASKYSLQNYVGPKYFPPTLLLKVNEADKHLNQVMTFAAKYGYPLMLKPDQGFTGRGVFKVQNQAQLKTLLPYLQIDYLVQVFVPFTVECGVFYVRLNQKPAITGINQKHFPTVVGDGHSTLGQLADAHPRRTHFWDSYLPYHDLNRVLKKGQTLRLSDIGSHTLGCCFTNDPNILTPALEQAVFKMMERSPGFNYGRLDLLADNLESLQQGKFTMVEANGVDALPTNVFDPKLNLWQSYHILFQHLKLLAQVAAEHRRKTKNYLGILAFARKSLHYKQAVEAQQDHLETLPDLSKLQKNDIPRHKESSVVLN